MLWVRVCCEHCECFSGFCCYSFSYFDETKRERERSFSISPFSTIRILTKADDIFFGMKRCALTYAFDGMQPNENIQFQLFALRETDGHILPIYESEYKQHTHTRLNEYSVRLALDVWVLHAYNKMQHIFLRIRLIQAKTSTFSAFSQNMRRRKRTATTHFWIFGGFFRHKLSFCTFFVLATKILVSSMLHNMCIISYLLGMRTFFSMSQRHTILTHICVYEVGMVASARPHLRLSSLCAITD